MILRVRWTALLPGSRHPAFPAGSEPDILKAVLSSRVFLEVLRQRRRYKFSASKVHETYGDVQYFPLSYI